jgi:nitrogen fixation protein FixH
MIRAIDEKRVRASRRWIFIVIGLLAAHVTGMLCAVWAISGRPGESAVIPDFYSKSLQWDTYRARQNASDQLGWKVDFQQLDPASPAAHKQVQINLNGSDGKPIENASLVAHCFQLSHGDQAATIDAKDLGSGRFLVTLPQSYSGFWQFELTATAGGKTFINSSTQYIN